MVHQLTISGKGSGVNMGRSRWVCDDVWRVILAVMMPANALAVEVSLATGLRISDVLALKTDLVKRTARPYVRDSKTGKLHRIYLPVELRQKLLALAGKVWCFEGRTDWTKHRTRAAVYKDMEHAVAALKRNGTLDRAGTYSPHSARKSAAVHAFQEGGMEAAARLLVHDKDHPAVTLLYALSDVEPTSRARKRRSSARSRRSAQSGQK